MIRHGVLMLLSAISLAHCIDMQWLPEDADGPLPMSKKYREDLAELCSTMERTGALPDASPSKLANLRRLCQQLKEANMHEPKHAGTDDGPASPLFFVLLVLGVAFIVYHRTVPGPLQSFRARKMYKKSNKKANASGADAGGQGASMTPEQMKAARDARLSRFEGNTQADKTD